MAIETKALDGTDLRLLSELRGDARVSLAELGRRVGLSAPAVGERLSRLERDGTVGYRVDVDPRALGYAFAAVLRMRPAPRQIPKVAAVARDTPEVVECHRVTGEDCFYMKLHVRSVEHLEEVIDRFTPYGQTTTSIVQSSPVSPRGVDLGAGAQLPGAVGDLAAARPPAGDRPLEHHVAAARLHDPRPPQHDTAEHAREQKHDDEQQLQRDRDHVEQDEREEDGHDHEQDRGDDRADDAEVVEPAVEVEEVGHGVGHVRAPEPAAPRKPAPANLPRPSIGRLNVHAP